MAGGVNWWQSPFFAPVGLLPRAATEQACHDSSPRGRNTRAALYLNIKRMRRITLSLTAAAVSLAAVSQALGAQESVAGLLNEAQAAHKRGNERRALSLANQAIELDPQHATGYLLRGAIYERAQEHALALADYDEAIRFRPEQAPAYNRRGGVRFKLDRIEDSIGDFDKAIELDPRQEPHHWQRGISYYYAGLYEKGSRQFASHQTVNPNDVENAVWHYLCAARLSGAREARGSILQIDGDSRVPMMQIYRLFRGDGTIAGVLEAARAGSPSPQILNQQLFYARLYIGLYHEANGKAKAARKNIVQAVDHQVGHYMWHVARVHAQRLKGDNSRQ